MIEFFQMISGSLAVFVAMAIMIGGMLLMMKLSRGWWRKRFREPFHEGILRPAGWGCLERRQDALFNFASIASALPVLWAGLAYIAITAKWEMVMGVALSGVPLTIIGLEVMRRSFICARTAKLGFLGECAVAEALAPLTGRGWKVFHDVPMEVAGRKFNIDHVAVGPNGVWAVETKAYSKAKLDKGREGLLKVEGEVIILPSGMKKWPMKQAKGQAASLRDRLNGVGFSIGFVEPLVVLPGWMVNYGRNASRSIRDPRNAVAFMEKQPVRLSEFEIAEVSLILEKWCRVLRFDPEEDKQLAGAVSSLVCEETA